MNLIKHEVQSVRKQQFIEITDLIENDIDIQEGICIVYTPHTTCGITINENCDPAVCNDMIYGFEKVFPTRDIYYHHAEGNSHSHMKSSVLGCTTTLIIHEGKLLLGTWQGIYLVEFDGPRTRQFFVKTSAG